MLMALGQFIFMPATLSFIEIQRQRSWNFSENAIARGPAQKQFIGAGADLVTLPGIVVQEHGIGNRLCIDELAAMADTGQGFVLIDGSGYMYGVYIIKDIDETRSILLFEGVPRKIDFTLKLERVDEGRIERQQPVSVDMAIDELDDL